MEFKTLKEMDLTDKKVLVRVDLNAPLDNAGDVVDDKKIRSIIPTIKHLMDYKAKIILISHLGRPDGEVIEFFRMNKVTERLSQLLGKEINQIDDCIGKKVENYLKTMQEDEIFMLENVRFHKEETDIKDQIREEFAKRLAEHIDIYVNDAFAVSHRKHASVYDITKFLPSCAGLLMEKEITMLSRVLNPERPFHIILGGLKISTKLPLLHHLIHKADKILLGGAMIFTFYKAKGYEVGKSIFEEDKINLATILMKNEKIVLPKDIAVVEDNREDAKYTIVDYDKILPHHFGFDIGPTSIAEYKEILKNAKTIFWNGPLGKYEWKNFSKGTNEIAQFLANLPVTKVVGGGDIVAAINKIGLAGKFTHVSTGGGAAMEFLEGIKLVGIKALEENKQKS